ncbi:hypothetical protein HOY80DRAFT_1003874 [Tuber brumale]|nr:hypothetical protein HOY80DRAFT_1003874 [Tuber brumale]
MACRRLLQTCLSGNLFVGREYLVMNGADHITNVMTMVPDQETVGEPSRYLTLVATHTHNDNNNDEAMDNDDHEPLTTNYRLCSPLSGMAGYELRNDGHNGSGQWNGQYGGSNQDSEHHGAGKGGGDEQGNEVDNDLVDGGAMRRRIVAEAALVDHNGTPWTFSQPRRFRILSASDFTPLMCYNFWHFLFSVFTWGGHLWPMRSVGTLDILPS